MPIGDVAYKAGGIAGMWAKGFRSTEVHRAADWDGQTGTFEEYTNNGGGARPSLIEDQENYNFVDSAMVDGYAYMLRHRTPGGLLSVFSTVGVVGDGTVTIMQAQKILARYVHPALDFRATWIEAIPSQVMLTEDGLRHGGNRPYPTATEYWLEVALLYQTGGTWEGINLTTAAEAQLTVEDTAGNEIITRQFTESDELVILDQSTPHSEGGNEGHLLIKFHNADTPAIGKHQAGFVVTFGSLAVMQFAGDFDIVDEG